MVSGSWVTCKTQRLQVMAFLWRNPWLGEHAQGAVSRCLATSTVCMLLQCRSQSVPFKKRQAAQILQSACAADHLGGDSSGAMAVLPCQPQLLKVHLVEGICLCPRLRPIQSLQQQE